MVLLTLPLSKGNRFLTKPAKELLNRELEARNTRAKDALKKALGGDAVDGFIKGRLTNALNERITPGVVYNNLSAPALGASEPPENWSQPLSLIQHAAALVRKSLTDSYFSRNFAKLSFTEEEFLGVSNVFADHLLGSRDFKKAQDEQEQIDRFWSPTRPPTSSAKRFWKL